ncbi:TcpE family conjugal transfer membrane protein [Nonomuraea sp. NPDC049309]|uniref:TcpE family conjugal transfer membrane protein n=1 Tax=Nonomuraea sp. NPDC049309 TaxID=3364350 RepID=UPI0037120626
MDLPTYTNIWRIEKRLYKLYDLRLPMPLPIVWIGVFVGVFVPWSLLLVLVGVPVEMPWHVLFLVPPGIVTWLSTRPVIEGKRLTELLESQLRYLGEPKAWYRLAPSSEPDVITFSGRVWRAAPRRAKATKATRAGKVAKTARKERQAERRRAGRPVTGPRQVRPAVAAAAAAASQAPVAEPASTRTGWGARRGTAPALKASGMPAGTGAGGGTVRREEGLSGGSGRVQEPVPLVDEVVGTARRAGAADRAVPRDADSADRAVPRDADSAGRAVPRDADSAGRAVPRDADSAGRAVPRDAGPVDRAVPRDADPAVPPDLEDFAEPTDFAADGPAEVTHDSGSEPAALAGAGRRSEPDAVAGVGRGSEPDAVAGAGRGSEQTALAGTGRGSLADASGEAAHSADGPGARSSGAASSADGSSVGGKPIDTEALRRLRKLAASADAPSEPADRTDPVPRADAPSHAEGDVRTRDARHEEEIARDQHRRGQPPRLNPALLLSGTHRVWPPLNQNAKPAPHLSRRKDDAQTADPADTTDLVPASPDTPVGRADTPHVAPADATGDRADTAGGPADTMGGRADGQAGAAGGRQDGLVNAAGGRQDGLVNAAGGHQDGLVNAAGGRGDGPAGAAGGRGDGPAGAAGGRADVAGATTETTGGQAGVAEAASAESAPPASASLEFTSPVAASRSAVEPNPDDVLPPLPKMPADGPRPPERAGAGEPPAHDTTSADKSDSGSAVGEDAAQDISQDVVLRADGRRAVSAERQADDAKQADDARSAASSEARVGDDQRAASPEADDGEPGAATADPVGDLRDAPVSEQAGSDRQKDAAVEPSSAASDPGERTVEPAAAQTTEDDRADREPAPAAVATHDESAVEHETTAVTVADETAGHPADATAQEGRGEHAAEPADGEQAPQAPEDEQPAATARTRPRSAAGGEAAAGRSDAGSEPAAAGGAGEVRVRSRSEAGGEAAGRPAAGDEPEAAERVVAAREAEAAEAQVIPLERERRAHREAAAERSGEDTGRAGTSERPVRERPRRAAGTQEPGHTSAAAQEPGHAAARHAEAGAGQAGDREGQRQRGVAPVPGPRAGEGRVRRVESVVGRDSGGWRRIAQVVVGGAGVRTDGSEIDEARARAVFSGSRRIVVLGCTGGAGQSTTALMLGHTFAQYRDDRVVAVDASTGGGGLTSKIEPETPETLTSLLSGLDRVSGYLTMRGYTTRTASGLEVISADTDAGAEQRLADRSFFSDRRIGESMRLLDRHYKLAVIDPAAALAARLLPYADQLVLVVPASEEAPEAVAMTYEWLDGHGCAELRRRAVMVVNGVSRRSMADVEQAESVARGRCRAIVRVPWEDDLAPGGAEVVDPGQLRAAGRRAYLALAGVVVAGFAAQTVRPSEEELASDPPGTRIGER